MRNFWHFYSTSTAGPNQVKGVQPVEHAPIIGNMPIPQSDMQLLQCTPHLLSLTPQGRQSAALCAPEYVPLLPLSACMHHRHQAQSSHKYKQPKYARKIQSLRWYTWPCVRRPCHTFSAHSRAHGNSSHFHPAHLTVIPGGARTCIHVYP